MRVDPRRLFVLLFLLPGIVAAQGRFVEPGTRPNADHPGPDEPLKPGDHWIRVRMEVDVKGRPTRCLILESDIRDSEQRFWACNAMMSQWHIEPILEDGRPVAGSVTRRLVFRGRHH